jgi:hypothetical protein
VCGRVLIECTSWHPRLGPLLIPGDDNWRLGRESAT